MQKQFFLDCVKPAAVEVVFDHRPIVTMSVIQKRTIFFSQTRSIIIIFYFKGTNSYEQKKKILTQNVQAISLNLKVDPNCLVF